MKQVCLSLLSALLIISCTAASQSLDEKLLTASPATIVSEPELTARMTELAESAVSGHCATCHGDDLKGRKGVPDLVDYDWIWGITGYETTTVEPVFALMQTILYGIRDRDCPDEVKRYGACPDTRYSEMPAYGKAGFTDQQLDDLVEYTLSISGREDVDHEAVARIGPLAIICAECHGEDGWGYKPYGGPDLSDDIWLYGDERTDIRDVLVNGRLGNCPPFSEVLDMVTVKSLAVYIFREAGFL